MRVARIPARGLVQNLQAALHLPGASTSALISTLFLFSFLLLLGGLSGCALGLPPPQVAAPASAQWQAPLPHQGNTSSMRDWWQALGDPLLLDLLDAAQDASPSIAQASARLQAARATQTAARAALLPRADATLGASRGQSQPGYPVATSTSLGAQASWELDVLGANRVLETAASAQVQSGQAQWHDARVAVAGEVASTYFGLRACERLADLAMRDASSREESLRLTTLLLRAGVARSADVSLAQASAADSRQHLTQQNAQCDASIKALVALSAIDEASLRLRLVQTPGPVNDLPGFAIAQLPARTIGQRPDVFVAERDVLVASAGVGSAKAQRWPRLSLGGSIGALRYSTAGADTDMTTWSFGPLAVTLPLFDAGQRSANVEAAQARYAESVITYRAKVRSAVREVEEALVALQSAQDRSADAALAANALAQALQSTTLRYRQGMASLVELEEVRRSAITSESALVALQLARQNAWVALYRAAGGGWESAAPPEASLSVPKL